MSLDDLITLLLVVLFVGAPLLQRLLRGGKGSQQPGEGGEADRGAGETARQAGRSAQETAEPGSRTARAEREAPSDGTSELQRRIEEARRRVREAREGGQPGSSSTSRPAPQAAAPPARPTREQAAPRPLVAPRESGATGFLGREGVTRQPTKKTPPLQVSKRKRKGGASKLSDKRVVSLDAHDILKGIVWHQILSERVGKRKFRRQPSRDR